MTKRIVRVEVVDEQSDCIAVELEDGSMAVLELSAKYSDPLFAKIKELSGPKTDGKRVYWANGASLTIDEIMKMLEE